MQTSCNSDLQDRKLIDLIYQFKFLNNIEKCVELYFKAIKKKKLYFDQLQNSLSTLPFNHFPSSTQSHYIVCNIILNYDF